MAQGGYRQPSQPAPVSGPGRFSQRTDGGPAQGMKQLANAAYGEQAEFASIQGGAPMASTRDGGAIAQQAARQMPPVTQLGAPTERPDEPVTAGSPSGAGPGPEAFGMGSSVKGQSSVDAQALGSYLPALTRMANAPGVPPSFVRFVRYIRSAQV